MRQRLILFTILGTLLFSFSLSFKLSAETAERWDIPGEIKRLYEEAPSAGAFQGEMGIVWLSSYNYTLRPDGTMEKNHRYLMLLSEEHNFEKGMSYSLPVPSEIGASIRIKEASWHNPSTGIREGVLPFTETGSDGIKALVISFPKETKGNVIAIETINANPKRYYLDDVLTLADSYPIWEQTITVKIPEGMEFYWSGDGVRNPSREVSNGVDIITWTMLNQPAWNGYGIIDEKRPTLVFSLQKGLMGYLKNMHEITSSFQAPPIPIRLTTNKNNLNKTGGSIAEYMRDKGIFINGYSPEGVRDQSVLPMDGPWTSWEQTLIAGKWLETLGWQVKVFWRPKLPVADSGANALSIWLEPILVVKQANNKNIVFKADQTAEFGKLSSMLYESTIYWSDGVDMEKMILPNGIASDHTLSGIWRLELDESGIATGALDLAVTGAWVDVFSLGKTPLVNTLASDIQKQIEFNVPGLNLVFKSLKPLNSGYRINFDVKAALGIVAGTDILLRIPGGVPVQLESISKNEAHYAFRFPFVLEQSSIISTPKGYKTVVLPTKTQKGDSKAMLEESIVHWAKKGQLQASSRWTVRSPKIDEALSKNILDQLSTFARWSQTTIPLRKSK